MALLEEEKARELLMLHAFKHANLVTNDLKIISMDIIKACGGFPLSLEVLGCYLCDIHDLEIWKGALHELKSGQNIIGSFDNEMIWKILRISYDHIKTCFWILLVFLSVSKKVHFVECIGMEMIHQTLCLYYKI
jgi:hypothetical protein